MKRLLFAFALTFGLGFICGNAFAFNPYDSFDNGTKEYIQKTVNEIRVLEATNRADADHLVANMLHAKRETINAMYIDMYKCPMRFSEHDVQRGYCKTRWIIKMKKFYIASK